MPNARIQPAPPTRKFRELLSAAWQRFNVLQRGERRCFGVTVTQCHALEVLHAEPRQTVRGLAERLGLDASTVTRVVDVLVRDGLVSRARDDARDRRRVQLSLTAEGLGLAGELERCADAYCERILARIPVARRAHVIEALGLLVEAIDELPDACATQPPDQEKP